MIVRLVRMTFRPGSEQRFLELFDAHKDAIRNSAGCQHLDLLQDTKDRHVFTTYSHWSRPEDLEAYRHSEVFEQLWPQVKELFLEPPRAWSFEQVHHLP